jgi:hypothetical protein
MLGTRDGRLGVWFALGLAHGANFAEILWAFVAGRLEGVVVGVAAARVHDSVAPLAIGRGVRASRSHSAGDIGVTGGAGNGAEPGACVDRGSASGFVGAG